MFTWNATEARQDSNGIWHQDHRNDFVMLVNGSERYMVQHGSIYYNANDRVSPDEAPAWFWEQYRRITPSTRELVGLLLPEDHQNQLSRQAARVLADFDQLPPEVQAALVQRLDRKPVYTENKAPTHEQVSTYQPEPKFQPTLNSKVKTWICDQCGEEVPMTTKGLHIGRHTRQAKRAAQV